MAIRPMRRDECLQMLATAKLARLACSHDNQPYVVPVYIAYQESPEGKPCLYGFTTAGQKVDWMRTNPLVCVEVDEAEAGDRWRSVIATGRYEELPEIPGGDDARMRLAERPRQAAEAALPDCEIDDERMEAYRLLQTRIGWWQPGYAAWQARSHTDPKEQYVPIFYKIRIDQVSGHEATKDVRERISDTPPKLESNVGAMV
jgi:uncharacterized protein